MSGVPIGEKSKQEILIETLLEEIQTLEKKGRTNLKLGESKLGEKTPQFGKS